MMIYAYIPKVAVKTQHYHGIRDPTTYVATKWYLIIIVNVKYAITLITCSYNACQG